MNIVDRYKTKPVEIEAIHLTPRTVHSAVEWMAFHRFLDCEIRHPEAGGLLAIKTLEGVMVADEGDYVIRGLRGEFYPCKPDVFHKKYELVKSVS